VFYLFPSSARVLLPNKKKEDGLINVINKHGDKTSYAYNGFGQRVQTIIDLEHGSENGNRPEKDKDNGKGNDKDNPGNHNCWENRLSPRSDQ